MAVKRSVFESIESQLKPEPILATNTSSLPLQQLSALLKKPERLVVIHFFNPVDKLPLVEVAGASETLPTVVENALAFVASLSKLPLAVKRSPGF